MRGARRRFLCDRGRHRSPQWHSIRLLPPPLRLLLLLLLLLLQHGLVRPQEVVDDVSPYRRQGFRGERWRFRDERDSVASRPHFWQLPLRSIAATAATAAAAVGASRADGAVIWLIRRAASPVLAQLVLFQIVRTGEPFPATGVEAREGFRIAPVSPLMAAQIGDASESFAAALVVTPVRPFT